MSRRSQPTFDDLEKIMNMASSEVGKWPKWKHSPDVVAAYSRHGIVLPEGATPVPPNNATQAPQMIALCEQALSLLETSVRALSELSIVFGQLQSLSASTSETQEAEIPMAETLEEIEVTLEEPISAEAEAPPPKPASVPMERPPLSKRRQKFLEQLRAESQRKDDGV